MAVVYFGAVFVGSFFSESIFAHASDMVLREEYHDLGRMNFSTIAFFLIFVLSVFFFLFLSRKCLSLDACQASLHLFSIIFAYILFMLLIWGENQLPTRYFYYSYAFYAITFPFIVNAFLLRHKDWLILVFWFIIILFFFYKIQVGVWVYMDNPGLFVLNIVDVFL